MNNKNFQDQEWKDEGRGFYTRIISAPNDSIEVKEIRPPERLLKEISDALRCGESSLLNKSKE